VKIKLPLQSRVRLRSSMDEIGQVHGGVDFVIIELSQLLTTIGRKFISSISAFIQGALRINGMHSVEALTLNITRR
jgi:hypothetical protein